MPPTKKLRLLALHSWRTSAQIFKEQVVFEVLFRLENQLLLRFLAAQIKRAGLDRSLEDFWDLVRFFAAVRTHQRLP